MKQITFYLDFISPYAYLAFEKLPEALKGISYSVTYKPLPNGSIYAAWSTSSNPSGETSGNGTFHGFVAGNPPGFRFCVLFNR